MILHFFDTIEDNFVNFHHRLVSIHLTCITASFAIDYHDGSTTIDEFTIILTSQNN